MKRNQKLALGLVAACGAVAGLGSVASAQSDPRPFVVHVSGATLLENYLNQSAATLDFIDVNGDRMSRGFPSGSPERVIQQLSPFELPVLSGSMATWGAGNHLGVLYSGVGSTRGLQELIDNGLTFNLGQSGRTVNFPVGCSGGGCDPLPTANSLMSMNNRSSAYFNRYKYITGGNGFDDNSGGFDPSITFVFNDGNAAGVPVRAVTSSGADQFKALYSVRQYDMGSMQYLGSTTGTDGITPEGGVTVDVAILDVPVRYAVTQSGTPAADRNPGESGYGNNGKIARKKDGSNDTGINGNKLALLSGGANINTASPDSNTIFDTPLFFAPIAPIHNFGSAGGLIATRGANAGVIKMSDLQYLYGAGRASNGENLMVVCRASDSGTRNGWQNSIGQDPSFGVGENVGSRNNSITNDKAGANYLPSNKGGNPRVEETVYNSRLGVGYVGPERGVENGGTSDVAWHTQGYAEVLSVINDIAAYGGTTPQRPTKTGILNNNTAESWVIGGPASLGTFGDPRANAPADGGYGWLEPYSDTNLNTMYDLGEPFVDYSGNGVWGSADDTVVPTPVPPAFPMRNPHAAGFVNNITRSIQYFEDFVIAFTPGELAATRFILTNALPRVQNPNDPTNLVTNLTFNSSLQTFIAGYPTSYDSAFNTYGSVVSNFAVSGKSRAGKVPARTPGTYTDSGLNAQAAVDGSYITQGGATLFGGGTNTSGNGGGRVELPLRNLVAGDFNADGKRDLNDIAEMIKAFRSRNGGPVWASLAASGDLATIATEVSQPANIADACIELLGDFNSDGNFNKADLRYFADGLGIEASGPNAGKLNRKLGFIALDNEMTTASAGATTNVFGTVLATNPTNTAPCFKAYAAGDSRADVANSAGRVTPGFQPIGAEGYAGFTPTDANVIDGWDIDSIYAQFRQTGISGCSADWSDYNEALITDVSCDINGDLSVNLADVTEVVKTILGTNFGDVNLDGVVNTTDLNIVTAAASANFGTMGNPFLTTASKWSQGDLNGDGVVTAADVSLVCIGDINGSGAISVQDIFDFLALYFAPCIKADVNGSGSVSVQDIFDFLGFYFGGGCPSTITCP